MSSDMEPFWSKVDGRSLVQAEEPILAQGDYLTHCLVPMFRPEYGSGGTADDVPVGSCDLVVVTQTCDLAQGKVPFAALCPIYRLSEFEETNPKFKQRGRWEDVRRGRVDGLHLLASPTVPEDNRDARVVDFRQIFSLPIDYLQKHADSLGERWRLRSPFLEHFSQAFARFFMRVGLPSSIPRYD